MIGYFPLNGGASRISRLTLGAPTAGYSTIVRRVRDVFARYVPFAGVVRERSTNVIVRLPTANGGLGRGCVVVALAGATRVTRVAFLPEPQPSSAAASPIERTIASAAPIWRAAPSRWVTAMAVHAD